jgi:DNA-binding response OmpR family regulator
MKRLLVIDPDRTAAQELGLACLERGVGAVLAEGLCDGVRALLATAVDAIVVDAAALRLTPREHATLFQRVAEGVPVVVTVRPEASLDTRVALELAGFCVLAKPVAVDDLIHKAIPETKVVPEAWG